MKVLEDRFKRILSEYPERCRVIKNYSRHRKWSEAFSVHGEFLGLTYDEMKALGCWLLSNGELGLDSVVRDRPQKLSMDSNDGDVLVVNAEGPRIKTLDGLLDAADVDKSKWIVTRYKVNTWEVASKDSKGKPCVTPVWQVKADLEPKRLNDLNPVRPMQALKREPPKARRDGIKRALFIPDSQHGFQWQNKFQRLEPLHDRPAIDVTVQLALAFQPDVIVLLGDMVDFAPWSTKFPRDPTLKQTTQPTLEELYWQLAQYRMACPRARIVYTAGNHEERLNKAQVQHLDEAVGLRFANDDVDEPILHMKRLLALDSLDIEYVGPYDTDWWLWNRVRIHHGSTVRGGGGNTAAARVKIGDWPEVFGHIHRLELAQRVVFGPGGPRTITAMSPGCLCRIDGAVPGVSKSPDWHHGVGIGYYDEVNDMDHLSVIPIHDGKLVFDGRVFTGEDRRGEIAEATGYSQIGQT